MRRQLTVRSHTHRIPNRWGSRALLLVARAHFSKIHLVPTARPSIVPMHRRGVVCNGIDDFWGVLRWRRIGMRLSEVCAQGRRSPAGAHTLGRVPRGSVTAVRMYMRTPLWMREGTSLSPPFTGTFLLRGPLAHVAYIPVVLVRGICILPLFLLSTLILNVPPVTLWALAGSATSVRGSPHFLAESASLRLPTRYVMPPLPQRRTCCTNSTLTAPRRAAAAPSTHMPRSNGRLWCRSTRRRRWRLGRLGRQHRHAARQSQPRPAPAAAPSGLSASQAQHSSQAERAQVGDCLRSLCLQPGEAPMVPSSS